MKLHLKDQAPATQGSEDKISNMCTAFFVQKYLIEFFSLTFYIILIEMGMGFLKTPSPHNNKYKQWSGETVQGLKYDYLEGHKHLTFSSMLSVLLKEFLPDRYLKLTGRKASAKYIQTAPDACISCIYLLALKLTQANNPGEQQED